MSDTTELENPEVEQVEAPQPDPVEARAREMGWKPKDEYKGTGEWRDAEEFIRQGETALPLLRKRVRQTDAELAKVRAQQAETLETVRYLTDMTRSAEERAYKRALAEVEAKREQAVEAGDKVAFKAAEAEMKALEPPKPAPRPATAAEQAPEALSWAESNTWFKSDSVLQRAAVQAHERLLQDEPSLSLAENLARVTETVRAMYPSRMPAAPPAPRTAAAERAQPENPRRTEAPAVSSSSAPAAVVRTNPKSFDAMPADSKAAYARYAKMLDGKGKPLTKEEWAETYWSQEKA